MISILNYLPPPLPTTLSSPCHHYSLSFGFSRWDISLPVQSQLLQSCFWLCSTIPGFLLFSVTSVSRLFNLFLSSCSFALAQKPIQVPLFLKRIPFCPVLFLLTILSSFLTQTSWLLVSTDSSHGNLPFYIHNLQASGATSNASFIGPLYSFSDLILILALLISSFRKLLFCFSCVLFIIPSVLILGLYIC